MRHALSACLAPTGLLCPIPGALNPIDRPCKSGLLGIPKYFPAAQSAHFMTISTYHSLQLCPFSSHIPCPDNLCKSFTPGAGAPRCTGRRRKMIGARRWTTLQLCGPGRGTRGSALGTLRPACLQYRDHEGRQHRRRGTAGGVRPRAGACPDRAHGLSQR